eukprot:c16499_g1_i3.p1 GENE.c16499_g1_i3~~c16499_g1_i3.p1  ORF type:complete len:791 (+),score=218.02 c16499_g1_i3:199-2373(+)
MEIGGSQVVQGMLGDCWFLSALSVVANRADILEKLFKNNPTGSKINPEGKYVVTFFYNQAWVDVTIDDRIPCTARGIPIYSKTRDPNVFWVPLIEKAYAKLHGRNYANLEGGVSDQGLANLCGYIGVRIYFDDLWKELTTSEEKSRMLTEGDLGLLDRSNPEHVHQFLEYSWRLLSINAAFGAVFCTGKSDEESGIEEQTPDGLLANHAYGILQLMELEGHKLVKLRNPWGKGEWTGRWSDDSPLWTPSLKQASGWKDEDDGIFFMAWEDFHAEFGSVFMQMVDDDEGLLDIIKELQATNPSLAHYLEKKGGADEFLKDGTPPIIQLAFDLKNDSAGGCLNYLTWRNCPQMVVKARPDKNLSLIVQVCQKDMRYTGTPEYNESIGFMIVKGGDFTRGRNARAMGRLAEIDPKNIVYKAPFQYSRFVTVRLTLPAYDGCYYVIGNMFHPTDDTDLFHMNIVPLTNDKTETVVEPAARDYGYEIKGALQGATAGGCPNFPTWINNPQYAINPMLGKAHVTLVLIPDHHPKRPAKEIQPQSLGLVVFPDQENASRIDQWRDPINARPDFSIARELVVANIPLSDFPYLIVPMAYKPEFQYPFTLYVYATSPLKFSETSHSREMFLHADVKATMDAVVALRNIALEIVKEAQREKSSLAEEVKETFEEFDTNKGGTLDLAEFRLALTKFSRGKLNQTQIDWIFEVMDEDQSGIVNYTEFAMAVTNIIE